MIITKAPVRISFFGGGTDYPEFFKQHGGAVLASSMDKFAYISVNHFWSELFDYSIRLSYRKTELAKSLEEIEHTPFRETLRHCGVVKDVEVHYSADFPAFTGLGSSSTFTVALLQALHAYCGRYKHGLELGYEAIHLERHVFGDNVGCQDQVLAAVGGLNVLEFRAEDNISVHRLCLPPSRLEELERSLLLVFTGVTRSASEMAGHLIRNTSNNVETLMRMRRMVDEGYDILVSNGPLTRFGELLHEAWAMKRTLATRVSTDLVDRIYETGRQGGAIGGKLLGAGGGGFLLFFVPTDRVGRVRDALSGFLSVDVSLAAPGSSILQSEGRRQATVTDAPGLA